MHTYLLCLGSNASGPCFLKKAETLLAPLGTRWEWGDIITSPAEGGGKGIYYNRIARLQSHLTPDALREMLKQAECDLGSTPADRSRGIVCIDIDILKQNGEVLRPDDWTKDYVRRALAAFRKATGQHA